MSYKVDVINAVTAITLRYNKLRAPLYAAIEAKRAGPGVYDKLEALNNADAKEQQAVIDAWNEYNTPEPEKEPEKLESSDDENTESEYKVPPLSQLTSNIKPPDNLPKPGEPGWTYEEYMAMLDAIAAQAASAEEPITKAIISYGPTGHRTGDVPIGLIDAREAIAIARNNAEQVVHNAWEAYNKSFLPPEGGGGEEDSIPTGFGDPNEPVPDPNDDLIDELAKKLGVGSAKNFVDHYIDNFIRGDGKQNENLTNLLSNKDMNWLKNNLKGESAINNPQKFDNPEKAFEDLMQRAPRGIRNSIGNGAKLDLDYYKKTGDYKIDKTYVFTSTSDLEYRGIDDIKTFWGYGPSLTKPVIDAPKNYAKVKMLGNVSSMINNPMQFHVIIPGPKKKKKKVNESNTFSKVKEFRNK